MSGRSIRLVAAACLVVAAVGFWSPRVDGAGFPGVQVLSLVVDPTNSAVVYAGTYFGGVYKTTDAGQNWARIDSNLPYPTVRALAIDPTASCTLYAGLDSFIANLVLPGLPVPMIIVRNNSDILVVSTDCGTTWTVVPPRYRAGRGVFALAITNATPPALYAYVRVNGASNGVSYLFHDIARVTPAATDIAFSVTGSNTVIATDPSDSCAAYIGNELGIVQKNSSCGAFQWSAVGTPLQSSGTPTAVNALAVHPTNHSLLAGTAAGILYQKADSVSDWSPVASVAGSINTIAFAPDDGQIAYAAGSNGTIYKSLDGGFTWNPAANFGTAVSVIGVGAIPTPSVYAAGDSFVSKFECSAGTLAVYCPFTDPVLTFGVMPIKAVHVAELRARVDLLRTTYQLPAFSWSDTPLVAGVTPVRARHLLELRAALADVYVAAGRTTPAYSDPNLDVGTVAKGVHIIELRNAVEALY